MFISAYNNYIFSISQIPYLIQNKTENKEYRY